MFIHGLTAKRAEMVILESEIKFLLFIKIEFRGSADKWAKTRGDKQIIRSSMAEPGIQIENSTVC